MLHVREKIAYGLGDTASNLIFQTVMLFLTYFYTDVYGLSAAAVGTMFLLVRLMDAVTDPMMGVLADNTRSRFGAFRPWLLWMALPFALVSVLAFTTPDFSAQGKLIYAYCTYGLLMLAYTAINIPYSALGGVLSPDLRERVSIQSYRFVFGMTGGLLVSLFTLPLVDYFGQGDAAKGYQVTIAVSSVLGCGLFLMCFLGTKERVRESQSHTLALKAQLAVLWRNDQWRVLSAAALVLLFGLVLRNTLAIYYVKYVLAEPDWITSFVTLGMIGNIVGCALVGFVVKKINKIKVYIGLQWISASLCVLGLLVPAHDMLMAFSLYFCWCLVFQMGTPILWSCIADTVDYGQAMSGIRMNGLVYSSVVFFIKLGLALGGAAAGWLLAWYGYEGGVTPKMETLQGIQWCFSVFPALAFVAVALIMRCYRLDPPRMQALHQQMDLDASALR